MWNSPCECGGSFRIPAGIYDHDVDGRLTFMRPLNDGDPVAGAPISFTFAHARTGDTVAIEAALHMLRRGDLSADEAADVLDEASPQFSWLASWLRARQAELSKNQLTIALAVIAVLVSFYLSSRPVALNDSQMDDLIERIDSTSPGEPCEADIDRAINDFLRSDE
jgi:hypothetical protein